MLRVNLNDNWQLTYKGLDWDAGKFHEVLKKQDGWLDVNIPCDVRMPLIRDGIIKEPLEADNCFESEWIEDKSWWFKKIFKIDSSIIQNDVVELTLESLDAEGDLFLNGEHIGHHKSAFYPFTMNVKHYLKEGDNVILVRLTTGTEYVSEYDIAGLKKYVSTETDGGRGNRGDKRRVFIRKPQFVFGWDWGPRVATCGIVKDAYLKAYNRLAIRSVYPITQAVSKDAAINFKLEIENLRPTATIDAVIGIDMVYADECVLHIEKEMLLNSGINFISLKGMVHDAKLWWPNGMGGQPLYTIKAYAISDEKREEYPQFKYGIRTLKLNVDKIGDNERKFAFEINGVTVFSKGGNWIPSDSIYARVSAEKYDTLIREAKRANFNMLRIWGGGIYENDRFYEKCDEYGILVWHDFMFGCALYPDHLDWFKYEVEKEMDYQTKRLRHHPSLVLWCGNNENQWIYENCWRNSEIPHYPGGIICYNDIAPRIVYKNCPEIPYWNSSPYGGEHPNDNDIGDRHHWHDCTMNEDMRKRITPEEYDKVESKFVSEYGYIGPCRKSSILQYHAGALLDKDGSVWNLHNNTFEKETVPAGIEKHYGDPKILDIDEYLLYAGMCQGLMLGYSLEAIRFKEKCWGSLFWMYNDCWGEVGWTIVDYYLKRKISYYFVKRAFAPVKLIMRENDGTINLVGINDTSNKMCYTVLYGYLSFDGQEKFLQTGEIVLEPFSKKVILKFEKESYDITNGVYCVFPKEEDERLQPAILRGSDFRNLNIPSAQLTISDYKVLENDISFIVSTNNYAHGVHFDLDDNIHLSDEYFDLLPGEARKIIIYNAKDIVSFDYIKPKSIYSKK